MKILFTLLYSNLFLTATIFADIPEQLKHLTFPNTTLKFEMPSNDMVRVTDELGQSWTRNLQRKEFNKNLTAKTIIFDMFSFDTSLVDHRLKYFASVPVGHAGAGVLIADTDEDSLMEIVGRYKAFEQKSLTFNKVFEQASINENYYVNILDQISETTSSVRFVSDINRNDNKEFVFSTAAQNPLGRKLLFYESPTPNQIADNLVIAHRTFELLSIHGFPRELDLDRDGNQEVLYKGSEYIDSTRAILKIYVAEYSDSLQTLRRVFSVLHNDDGVGVSGDFAVHDFDLDGKMEFVTAENNGTVYWMEHTGIDNDYHEIQQIKLPLSNAYFHTEGDDLDGDGRPECIIGGDGQMDGKWGSVLTFFETSGDNQFDISVVVMLAGLGGLNAANLTQCDIDGDGQKEAVLSYGGSIVVLESTGDDYYEIKWVKHTHYEVMVSVGDATGDGIDDLVRSRKNRKDGKYAYISDIFTSDSFSTFVNAPQTSVNLAQNFVFDSPYPNPFNSSIKIKWEQVESSELQMDIFNATGQKIVSLTNEVFGQGQHFFVWNGTNEYGEPLPSGIYFCRMRSKSFLETAKILLIR
ncbi:VCBS repeat-containing protein [candidate division KSB1 bacterium]|nr:VCBS repeat-containing protein [candidate division KSB1 bacterium]